LLFIALQRYNFTGEKQKENLSFFHSTHHEHPSKNEKTKVRRQTKAKTTTIIMRAASLERMLKFGDFEQKI